MGKYINSVLLPDEEIKYNAVYTKLDNPIRILLIPVFGLGLILLYFSDKTRELACTNKRIIAKEGWISRNTVDYPLGKIENVEVYQGILGRIFGFGSIQVTGTGGTAMLFKGVKKPEEFKQKLNELRY